MSFLKDEGYIKFDINFTLTPPLQDAAAEITELNFYRNEMYRRNFIGAYEDGIGFGNISKRYSKNPQQFIISGTQAGSLAKLTEQHYTLVTSFDIPGNKIYCSGPVKASSESLTHAALYELNPEIGAVIHIHNLELWKKLLYKVPTSSADVPYGTHAMALEMQRLYQQKGLDKLKIMAMAGHEEGIITFGKDLQEAADVLFRNIELFNS
jgi:L-ribulose-5-phosphate 4-epimerase